VPAIGEVAIRQLVQRFYQRVRQDPVIGVMYPPDDWTGAEERLADFLVFRFGGPDAYLAKRGAPRLRMRHAPFAITKTARDRWVELMLASLQEANLPEPTRGIMTAFLGQTATFLMNSTDEA
jgi:hemoglobin